jgi:hypothetical protein
MGNRKRRLSSTPQVPGVLKKPLGRLPEYLVQLKVCTALTREWLIEVKDLSFVLALIWGVFDLLRRLHH